MPANSTQEAAADELELMGRLSAAIWTAIALFGVLSGLTSINPDPENLGLLRAASILALIAGAVSGFVPWQRVPKQVFLWTLVAMSIVIGVLSYAAGPQHGDLTLLFTFVVVFAAYFFGWKVVMVQLCLIAAVLMSRLALFGIDRVASDELVRLAILLPALLVVAWLVSFLRKHIAEQAARLRQVSSLLDLPLDQDRSVKGEAGPPGQFSRIGDSTA